MKLGAFSLSLSVKDIVTSLAFYQKLGFQQVAGNIEENWLILRNEQTTLGLFQGMFDKNTLTFNPGWDAQGGTLEDFDDVRLLQDQLKQAGVDLIETADAKGSGPAYLTLLDPDGNPILIDQHV